LHEEEVIIEEEEEALLPDSPWKASARIGSETWLPHRSSVQSEYIRLVQSI